MVWAHLIRPSQYLCELQPVVDGPQEGSESHSTSDASGLTEEYSALCVVTSARPWTTLEPDQRARVRALGSCGGPTCGLRLLLPDGGEAG